MDRKTTLPWVCCRAWLGVMLLASVFACGRDEDSVVLDFSQTLVVEERRAAEAAVAPLRMAVGAMISPRETFATYRRLVDYLGGRVHQPAEMILRKTYGEVSELLQKGRIDVAFICSGPYALGRETFGFQLLAAPEVHGSHDYRAYLIVNRDSPYQSLEELRGKVFAFTDQDSNTGKLVPTYWLAKLGENPDSFFSRTLFTYSHDNSILAVARALVDGASVDSLIWDYYRLKNPEFTAKTRIIKKSKPYGIPPLVGRGTLPDELRNRLKEVLFGMHRDPEGRDILEELMIERFIAAQDAWYDPIRRMQAELKRWQEEHGSAPKPQG